jgi:hypothetical protein
MKTMDSIERPWFRARQYGLGAGLPIVWQGWVAIGLFVAAVPATLVYVRTPLNIVFVGIVVAAFTVVAAAKTKGGWRWRWGRED